MQQPSRKWGRPRQVRRVCQGEKIQNTESVGGGEGGKYDTKLCHEIAKRFGHPMPAGGVNQVSRNGTSRGRRTLA